MKIVPSLLLSIASTLAAAAGGPTAGRAPVPQNHRLVHEYVDANGLYTEIFANVYVKDKYVAANVVVRTNDGISAKDSASLFTLASTAPCEGEGGLLRTYIQDKEPSEHNWRRVVPERWESARRYYSRSEDMKDVVATEMCLQTHQPFAGYLQGDYSERVRNIIREGDARQAVRDEAQAACKARASELDSERMQHDADLSRIEKRNEDNDSYRESLERRRRLLEAAPGNYGNVTANLAAQWRSDQADFNRRIRALAAEADALASRQERFNARIESFNAECAK